MMMIRSSALPIAILEERQKMELDDDHQLSVLKHCIINFVLSSAGNGQLSVWSIVAGQSNSFLVEGVWVNTYFSKTGLYRWKPWLQNCDGKKRGNWQSYHQIHTFCSSTFENTEQWLIILTCLHSVDLEVWNKLAKRACIMRIAPKCVCDFDWQLAAYKRVFPLRYLRTLRHVLLSQIISYPDTKVPVLVVMEYKRASVSYI